MDSGYTMSIIDRDLLKQYGSPTIRIETVASVPIQGVAGDVHNCGEVAFLDIYLPGFEHGTPTILHMKHCARIVDNLKPGMLIGNDIIYPEGIVVNTVTRRLEVQKGSNTDFYAPITVEPRAPQWKGIAVTKRETVIPP